MNNRAEALIGQFWFMLLITIYLKSLSNVLPINNWDLQVSISAVIYFLVNSSNFSWTVFTKAKSFFESMYGRLISSLFNCTPPILGVENIVSVHTVISDAGPHFFNFWDSEQVSNKQTT